VAAVTERKGGEKSSSLSPEADSRRKKDSEEKERQHGKEKKGAILFLGPQRKVKKNGGKSSTRGEEAPDDTESKIASISMEGTQGGRGANTESRREEPRANAIISMLTHNEAKKKGLEGAIQLINGWGRGGEGGKKKRLLNTFNAKEPRKNSQFGPMNTTTGGKKNTEDRFYLRSRLFHPIRGKKLAANGLGKGKKRITPNLFTFPWGVVGWGMGGKPWGGGGGALTIIFSRLSFLTCWKGQSGGIKKKEGGVKHSEMIDAARKKGKRRGKKGRKNLPTSTLSAAPNERKEKRGRIGRVAAIAPRVSSRQGKEGGGKRRASYLTRHLLYRTAGTGKEKEKIEKLCSALL